MSMILKIYDMYKGGRASEPTYLLKVDGEGHYTLKNKGGGTPLSLSYVFGDKGGEMEMALAEAENVEEMKAMCEALAPKRDANTPYYAFDVWNPRELLKKEGK